VPLSTDAQGRQVYRILCPLPPRNGRHVVFVTWQRSDSPEAFYACSDVQFTGGVDPGYRQIGAVQAGDKLPIGTVVTFRLFDETGRDLERIDATLSQGETSRRAWPFALAQKVDATSSLVRIGVLQGDGSISPSRTLNGNLVYARAGQSLRFAIDIAKPGSGGAPTYPDGIGSYGPGSVVRGTDGFLYECRPFPNSGWCNQAPAYYAPGGGSNWADAWVRR
jgi:chitin-binding protein